MQFGSHIYGTNLPTSDHDYKGIFVPSGYDLVMQKAAKHIQNNTKKNSTEKNSPNDIDEELFSVQTYLRLLAEGQTVALDMLFTPGNFYLSSSVDIPFRDIWRTIKHNKDKLIHSGSSAFVGYCKTQAAKYGLKGGRVEALRRTIDFLDKYDDRTKLKDIEQDIANFVYPGDMFESSGGVYEDLLIKFAWCNSPKKVMEKHLEVCNRKVPLHATVGYAIDIFQRIFDQYGHRALMAERNEGIDWKALMHAVRVADEAYELLTTGNITFPRPNADLLLKIRKGELPYKEVETLIENGLVEVEKAKEKSTLRKTSCQNTIDSIIYEAHMNAIGRQFKSNKGD